MHSNYTKNRSLLSMLKGYASHTRTSESSQNSESTEPRLEASVTLSGNEQVPDYLIGKSKGVDPNKFFSPKNMEHSLQASLTLGSGKGQGSDSFIDKSNGVDSSKFLTHEDDDLTMLERKPQSNLGVLGAMVSPLKAINPVKTK